jgi:hypothetical protein
VFGTKDVAGGRCGRTCQAGLTWEAGRAWLVWHVDSIPPLKCVPVHKNCNTTRGTLLVSKICMKLVYSSRTRGFDGRIFVVRTVNKLPQDKHLLVLEQNLDMASVDQGLQDVITQQVPTHKLHALLANLKRLVREKLSLTLPVGLLAFHLAFGG